MLVLSRKETETIVIGDDITITIERVQGSRVKVGIDTPRDVMIRRGELAPRPQSVTDQAVTHQPRGVPVLSDAMKIMKDLRDFEQAGKQAMFDSARPRQ